MQKLGADYVAFGSCFPTKTKLGAKIMDLNNLEISVHLYSPRYLLAA